MKIKMSTKVKNNEKRGNRTKETRTQKGKMNSLCREMPSNISHRRTTIKAKMM